MKVLLLFFCLLPSIAQATSEKIKEGSPDGLIIQRAIDFLGEVNADSNFINKAYEWLSSGKFYKDKLDHNAETNLRSYDITFSLPKVTPSERYLFLRHPYTKETAIPHHPFEVIRQNEFRFLVELAATLYHELVHTKHTSDMGEAIIENDAWTTTIEAMEQWTASYKNDYLNSLDGGNCKKLNRGMKYKSLLDATANYIQDFVSKEYSKPYHFTYKKRASQITAESAVLGKELEKLFTQKEYFNRDSLKRGSFQYCIGTGLAKSGITIVTLDKKISLQGTTEHELGESPVSMKYQYESDLKASGFFRFDDLPQSVITTMLNFQSFFKIVFPYSAPTDDFEVELEFPKVQKNADGNFTVVELGKKSILKISTPEE